MKVPRILGNNGLDDTGSARNSPRHRKLQKQQQRPRDASTSLAYAAADAFVPNKSLRLASLVPREDSRHSSPDTTMLARATPPHQNGETSRPSRVERATPSVSPSVGVVSPLTRTARFLEPAPPIVPLHEVVRGFDDAVDASPLAESNQVAVTSLFLSDWMERFERDRSLYKSIVVHAEIAFRELYRLTANLAAPNDIVTAFACKIFDNMTKYFGAYETIARVLSSEFRQAIYAPPSATAPSLPYFAIVKNQKRILILLRKAQLRRQERNDFLRFEIDKVHDTFLHFLDQCGLGLVRTIFREWYSAAVTSKRNSKKYIEYFSAWFGGSAKTLVPRIFLAWKHAAVETKVARMHEQLASDHEKRAALQKEIDDLTVQRDMAQLESLAIRNDRKHAEDTIQRLHRKIQSASAFLESSQRREALVAQEGQLRVEAATFLPPLVLESLLRGFHNVGFLQPLHSEFAAVVSVHATTSGGNEGTTRGARPSRIALTMPRQVPTPTTVQTSALMQCIAALQSSLDGCPAPVPPLTEETTQVGRRKSNVTSLANPSAATAASPPSPDGSQDSRRRSPASSSTMVHEIPLHDCISFFQGVRVRMEDDPTAHLLFLTKADRERGNTESAATHHSDQESGSEDEELHETPLGLQELVHQFNVVLRNVRHQDEHYARHAKLFSSRMLEHNEISVVPHSHFPSAPSHAAMPTESVGLVPECGTINLARTQRVPFSSIDSARVMVNISSHMQHQLVHQDDTPRDGSCSDASLDQLPLFRAQDLELSPRHTRAFVVLSLGQLVAEYGSLLFSPTDMTAFVRNRVLQKVMLRGIAGGKHTLKKISVPTPIPTQNGEDSSNDDNDEHSNEADDAVAGFRHDPPKKEKTGVVEALRKHTTQRRMQLAPRRISSYRGIHAPIAREIDKGLAHLIVAYDMWNRLSQQLFDAQIVHSRGAIMPPDAAMAGAAASAAPDAGSTTLSNNLSDPTALHAGSDSSISPFATLRPRLHLHIEPLAGGPLMVAAKEKDRSDALTTPNGLHRRSMASVAATEWSYQTSKVRLLSMDDAQQLLHSVKSLHEVVRGTAQQRAAAFNAAKINLKRIRSMQWREACDLASQFLAVLPSPVAQPTEPSPIGATLLDDGRRHLFECVTFENDAIERLFSVEDEPEEELQRVMQLLERKKHLVRHALYCKHRPGTAHAASLEDLWHVVKVLRLPRDVRVLPTLRDEELAGSSYFNEQFFSPDDLAEVVLQLCNEQFLPHVTPLSARVEFLVAHHLPLAMQNQSAIREVMHKPDVKKALSDHGQTLRTIFRRYCAKEKELAAAAAAKRRAAIVAATASTATISGGLIRTSTPPAITHTHSVPSPPPVGGGSGAMASGASPAPPHAPQGITKFMRLSDWHDFISDYKLLRPRFTAEYATTVFRNVQEAESGLDDDLEMIYGEFCEAVVALAVCFFPDPFLRHATRVHQFIRRYLPVSPEETRDHHV